jgi:HEAT repeat protein
MASCDEKVRNASKARPRLTGAVLALAATFGTAFAHAAAFVGPGTGQSGLAVGVEKGVLRASVCAREPCDLGAGLDLGVPAEYRQGLDKARLAKVAIGGGRRAIVASVPGKDGTSFEVVVAAPLSGSTPKLIFAGVTGLVEGADGVRQGKVVTIAEPDESGARSIVVGQRREDLDLCGRPAVLAPEVLNPADLALRAAKMQRLTDAERASAEKLVAQRLPDDAAPATTGILRAVGASSAVGSPAALTDGRADSLWAEARGGSGRGEYVVMNAPQQLPLTGFELVLTPAGVAPKKANLPRELWLVTQKQLYEVTLPSEASERAGARFFVTLPAPVKTDCVALVLESAFEERAGAVVGVAELAARTDLSAADPKALFGALAGGGERAEAAGALLRALGAPAYAEIEKGFDGLDEGGRRVALEVVDAGPCEASVPVYVKALVSSFEQQRAHAQTRLRRCGRVAAVALSERFQASSGNESLMLAGELGLVAPDSAVEQVTARLGQNRASSAERRQLRIVLSRAAADERARASVVKLLSDPNLPGAGTLGLLRALGPRAAGFQPQASQALARLAGEKGFATRYLVLAPAAALAQSDAAARSLLLHSFGDASEPRLRTRALEVMPRDATAAPVFVQGLADQHVRVREAAAHGVRDGRVGAATPKLLELLDDDEWPIVRAASAEALAALPAEQRGDKALIDALKDEAPIVRTATAKALGNRRVFAAAEPLRDRLIDKDERVEVRRATASALAALCDGESVAPLQVLTQRLADPLASAEERALAEASLTALVQISPPDLNSRLAPLEKTPAAPKIKAALARGAAERRCTSQ